jgi:hypothetical protein
MKSRNAWPVGCNVLGIHGSKPTQQSRRCGFMMFTGPMANHDKKEIAYLIKFNKHDIYRATSGKRA